MGFKRYIYQGTVGSKDADGVITYYKDERKFSIGFDNTDEDGYGLYITVGATDTVDTIITLQ